SVYYVPGIMALGIIAASFVNLVISVTAQRESGVLKRRRATPVPATAVIGGRALTAVVAAPGMPARLPGTARPLAVAHAPAPSAQPAHRWFRLRRHRPAHRGRLGCRRPPHRPSPFQLAPIGPLIGIETKGNDQ